MRTAHLSFTLTCLAWLAGAAFLRTVGAVVAPGAVSTLAVGAWGAAFASLLVLGRWPMVLVAGVGGAVAALDLYAFARARQGLSSLVEIGGEEGLPALAMVLDESGIGAGQIAAMLGGCGLLGGLAAALWHRLSRREVPTRRVVGGLALALILAALVDPGLAVPRLFAHFWGEERLIAGAVVRRGALPEIPLPAGRDPISGLASRERQPSDANPPGQPAAELPPDVTATRVLVVVVEALRADAIDPAVTPHMARFAARASRWRDARSAGDATHPGWYSVLYGRFGLAWHRLRHGHGNGGARGGPALRLLAERGGLGVWSGARLDFYAVDEVVLGLRSHARSPTFVDARACHADGAVLRSDCDRCAVDQLLTTLRAGAMPAAGFVFFDGTHIPYDWPADTEPRFVPVTDPETLRRGDLGPHGVAGLKNRYRSALHAVDTQFGRIVDAVAASPEGERTLIVLTGDHGEEFLEHGMVTHASEPCALQSRVPILIAGPGFPARERPGMAAHADILPTLLRARGLLGEAHAAGLGFDGVPLQRGEPRDWGVVVHAGAKAPFLFALHRGDQTLQLAFADHAPPHEARALRVVDDWPRARIAEVFGPALRALFGVTRADILGR